MPTDELVKAVPPQALLVNRMMVDNVVEAPGGAHFTTAAPDYGRDEKFQRHYAQAAAEEATWAAVRRHLSVRQRGRLPGGGAAIRRAGGIVIQVSRAEVCVDRLRRTVPRRRRDHGQPDDHHRVDRRPAGPPDLRAGHPADRRRGPTAGRHPGDRRPGASRGLDAVRPGLRDPGLGPAPRRDGRQPDRPVRQPEPVRVRPAAAPDPADVRRPRRARQHHQPRHQLLGGQPLHAGVLRHRRHGVRNRLGQGRSRTIPRIDSSTSTGW